jgi:hypothetical protein
VILGFASLQLVEIPWDLNPGYAGVERAAHASGSLAGIARGGQARFSGLTTSSTRQTTPKSHSAASELAPLLDGSTAGELIPQIVRHGLQQLIELEVAFVLGAERHERSEDRLGYRNGYRPPAWLPRWVTSTC